MPESHMLRVRPSWLAGLPHSVAISVPVRHDVHELVRRVAQDFETGGSEGALHLLWRALARTAARLARVEGPMAMAHLQIEDAGWLGVFE